MEVFYAATRGHKYQLFVVSHISKDKDGNTLELFDVVEYTSGKQTSTKCNRTESQIHKEVPLMIRDYKEIDRINYHVVRNALGIRKLL